jgi:hypothetical protein
MAVNFGTDSTQGSMLVTTGTTMETADVVLKDSDGNTLVTFTPSKSYNSVLISIPELAEGETYTLETGETTNDVTMESLIQGSGDMMGGGGFNGGGFGAGNDGDANNGGGFGGGNRGKGGQGQAPGSRSDGASTETANDNSTT